MTLKNEIIKLICETVGLVLNWFFWYIVIIVVSVIMGANPMDETAMCLALGILCLSKIERLEKGINK